ncbi:MAG: dicarboxylate/amino acid:cation symporter [Candidatus Wallbacteria bacterium HGW-Wallbacteria-1]|jgi:Na+/H+-dicarboxylate symporter|uniref:Dicarboxylate/amino acid:cation symporter n=1 Tax=Candidatus Wallbacteria bacterium HGW-Wallbacteria-1 TaxID=2013854 RepID=A0A2N1PKS3_9BACT|nr:MAG: dicarboxylate/amino acid:cation symporter [Candidatus Wallbacteria bacterium HGW-Wallbacteria-1]
MNSKNNENSDGNGATEGIIPARGKGASAILLMMILGLAAGLLINHFAGDDLKNTLVNWFFAPLGTAFLKSIQMLVVPLVFFSLAHGTASLGNLKRIGRIGGSITVYYLATTALAVTIALLLTNVAGPGKNINLKMGTPEINSIMNSADKSVSADSIRSKIQNAPGFMEVLLDMIPRNPFKAMVEGKMLQLIFFSIILGISVTTATQATGRSALAFFETGTELMLGMIGLVMKFAPIGVFALVAKVASQQGADVLFKLMAYMLTMIGAFIVHGLLVYSSALKFLAGVSPLLFFRKFWKVMVVAFSTSSSNATIPVTLEACERDLGVPENICSFTIPFGATINMDGTAIMQGVAAIFVAQLYGIHLGLTAQLQIILTATLASIGTAGVPGVGLVMLAMVFQQVGLPLEAIGILWSVDRVLDMCRTAVNVTGDAVGSVVIARFEGVLDDAIMAEKP